MGPYFGDLFQQVLYPHRIESRLDLRQRSGRWTWAQSTVPKTQVSRHVESYRMPDLRKFGPQKCRISLLMNWFFIESFQETMFFLPGNIKFSCKLSHHPILGHYELKKMRKKNTPCSQGNASRCCGSVMRSVISPYGLGKHWWLVLCQYLGFLQKSPGNLPWVGMIHHGHIPWCVHSLCENLIHIACFVIFIIPKSRPFAG